MKKTRLIFLLISFCLYQLNAQSPFSFGVKGGVNFSDQTKIDYAKIKPGFNVGLTVDYALTNNFYILSGLELTSKGSKYNDKQYLRDKQWPGYGGYGGYEIPDNDQYFKVRYNRNAVYLQAPIQLGYKLRLANDIELILKGGAYLAYGISGKYTIDVDLIDEQEYYYEYEYMNDYKEDFFNKDANKLDLGLSFGTRLEYKKIFMDLGYEIGLKKIWKSRTSQNRNLPISLGYKF